MTSQQASEFVDRVRDDLENYEGDDREERWARFRAWHMDRILLYPEIYASELRDYLKNELAEGLHSYVRSRITGCSARLTKSKIREVVKVLTNEDSVWWQNPNHGAIFFERLREVYPECCDGRSPVVEPGQLHTTPKQISLAYPTKSFHRPKSRKKNGSDSFVGMVVVVIVLWILYKVFMG